MKTTFIIVSLMIPLIGIGLNHIYPDLKNQVLEVIITGVETLNRILQEDETVLSSGKCLKDGEKLFTKQQLAKYDGSSNSQAIYLSYLGTVYDVTKGARHYQTGGAYSFFAGKDASRAFVTGQFDADGLVDDVQDLSLDSFGDIKQWQDFYDSEYPRLGKLLGTYYDAEGCPTSAVDNIKKMLDQWEANQEANNKENEIFPHCNSEYHAETKYHRVWCTDKSGGVQRQWTGVPRQLYLPKDKTYRCACVKNFGQSTAPTIEYADDENDVPPQQQGADGSARTESKQPSLDDNKGDLNNPRIKEYPECNPTATECVLKS
ncbi:neuferricin isoform X2 [Brevipalpus obovatus]|uniref:neuferricin isoform X2 n=1 Tax=Brevipalpus obovatus TaxID=246614 RepID=UPI003D9E7C1A